MSCYPLQSNVLHVRRSFSSDFGNVQKSATIWGLDIFTQNPKTVCCFPQIFSKLWSGSPNVRQLLAIWSPTVPKLARHLVAKCLSNHLKTITLSSPMIAEFANYSPILSIFWFANCLETGFGEQMAHVAIIT